MEIKIKHIEHAHSEYGHVGYIELTNNTKIWFGGKQPIKDEDEAMKIANLYVASPKLLESLEGLVDLCDKLLDEETSKAIGLKVYREFVESVKSCIR